MHKKNFLEIGRLIKEHGVKGDVKVEVYSGSSENLRPGLKVVLKKEYRQNVTTTIESFRPVADGVLVKFAFFSSPEAAKSFRQAGLLVNKADLKPLKNADYYLEDLIGFSFYDQNKKFLGTFKSLQGTKKTSHFLIETSQKDEILIPLVMDWIKKIDVKKNEIICEMPEGLIETQLK